MYFYTLSVLDMEANFLPAVGRNLHHFHPWYVRITAYDTCIWNIAKTNSVMFFYYFHYEIVCNCWNKFKKSSTNLWFYMLSRLFQNEKKTLKFTSTIGLSQWSDRVSFVVLWIWHRFYFLCNVPTLRASDKDWFVPEIDLNTEHVFHNMSENHTTSRLQTMLL